MTAQTDDGLIMGLAHREHTIHGVQFHPESIASEHGHRLLGNFLSMTTQGRLPNRTPAPMPERRVRA